MAQWEKRGNFMFYQRLDAANLPTLTVAFRFRDCPQDPWTSRLNAFKAGDAAAVAGACRALPAALRSLPFRAAPIVLTSAVPSGETHLPAEAPLAVLGESVAQSMGWAWRPDMLRKRAHRSLHTIYNAAERDAEVRGAYTADVVDPAGLVFILDDFVTRGATLGDAARALKEQNPNLQVAGLVLGKTESLSYWNGQIDNSHVPTELTALWDGA
jgi:hypothetical protein